MRIKQIITERCDESLRTYFREISKIPLLTKEQELELAQKVKTGDKKAADKLVESNLRFAISVAKQYQGNGLALVDLIQIANEGLIYAASRFDPDTNNKFISFAVWHIRQHITRALSNQSRTVRLPTSHIQTVSKIKKINQQYLQKYGRIASQEELEQETNVSKQRISAGLTVANKAISFDSPLRDVDEGTLLDITPSNMFPESDVDMVNSDINKAIENILSKLSPRNSDLIRLTYGINVEAVTLDEAGRLFGIGAERVRQINQKTIKQIQKQFKNLLKHLV